MKKQTLMDIQQAFVQKPSEEDIPERILDIPTGPGTMYKGTGEFAFANDAHKVICPYCGDDYVHPGKTEIVPGNDNYDAWAGRGELVKTSFWCEQGHTWMLCFGFHKGQTYRFWLGADGEALANEHI